MKKYMQDYKKIASQIKFWLTIGLTTLIAFLFIGLGWVYFQDSIIKKIASAIIITSVITWCIWTSIIICQLINHRTKEQKLIEHLAEQIREIRKEFKSRFFK